MSERTCLSYWFPKLQAAGLPVPRTEIVRAPNLDALHDGGIPKGWGAFLAALNVARDKVGGSCFLRTGQGSGKHQWKETCCLPETANIAEHVARLVEWSACVDFMGLPTNVWAVREMLPAVPVAVCPRYGDMPVCREFRFFATSGVNDSGIVLCHHPYWPREALEQGGATLRDDQYENLCYLPAVDTVELFSLARLAAQTVGGEWSVDILETRRGWYVTDMAEADRSWHWPGCSQAARSWRLSSPGPSPADVARIDGGE